MIKVVVEAPRLSWSQRTRWFVHGCLRGVTKRQQGTLLTENKMPNQEKSLLESRMGEVPIPMKSGGRNPPLIKRNR